MTVIMDCWRFEKTAADLTECAAHINDVLTGQHELSARLRLVAACKLVLEAVGFEVKMHREPIIIEDDDLNDLLTR